MDRWVISSQATDRQRSNSLQTTATLFNSVPLLPWSHFLRLHSWQLHEALRRNSLSNSLLSVLVHDQVPNIVFAWRRVKKLLGSNPILFSVFRGKPGGKTGSSHQGGSSPFRVGISPAVSDPILGETASGHFQAEPFRKQSDFPEAGPQSRAATVGSRAQRSLDRVAGGSIIALAEMVQPGSDRPLDFKQAPSGSAPFSRYCQRSTNSRRASATMPMRRARLPPFAKRS